MSELQRRWAKAKMDALAAGSFDEREEEEDEEDAAEAGDDVPVLSPKRASGDHAVGGIPIGAASMPAGNAFNAGAATSGGTPHSYDDDAASLSSASSASSTGTVVPSASHHLFARPQGTRGRTLDPIPWTTFFERELFLQSPDDSDIVYHAYLTSPVGKGPLFVMHHGAGSSGLSFAVTAADIRKRLPSAGILSLDARDHGLTKTGTSDAKPLDLHLATLSSDLFAVINLTKEQMHWPETPPIVLVGHSLGGAVVTDLAHSGKLDGGNPAASPLLGFAVLDVVEGSAMDALKSMQTYLSTRPSGFATLQSGIEWHIRSRTVRNATSARTSVPALLINEDEEKEAASAASKGADSSSHSMGPPSSISPDPKRRPWQWRTDLGATQPFWEDWFIGLSKKFLTSRGGKLLLLAGTDRLDTELTIGQMQGKYALQVFPEAGHFIHEDLPEKTAMTLVDFYRRNDRTALVLPPKVSELLAQGKKV